SEGDISIGVRGVSRDRTEVSLAFAIAARIAGSVGIEVDCELLAGNRVERSLNGLGASSHQRRSNNREILQAIGSAVGVLRIVRRHPIGSEIDAKVRTGASVGINRVTPDSV